MSEIDPRARSYVIWLLGRRDYSRFQLEQKLKKRGLAAAEIKALLDNLIANGWYKEETYQRVRTRQILNRGFGPAMAKAKLRGERITIDKADVDRAYDELATSAPAHIRALIEKYLRIRHKELARLKPFELRGKILNSLLRKGYPSGEIIAELNAVLAAKKSASP